MKVDLHMHSTYSDGTYNVSQLVQYTTENDFDYIAVTDHNCFRSAGELKASCTSKPIAIAGIELSIKYNGKKLHLLGYFNADSDFASEKFKPLYTLLNKEEESKKVQIKQIIDNLSQDFDVNYDEFLRMVDGDGFINRVHIARYLTQKGVTTSVSNAFQTVINSRSRYYSHRKEMSLDEGLNAIVKCGGLPCIAHFVEYEFTDSEIDEIAQRVSSFTNTVGVELWHYKQNADFRKLIVDRCSKYNMLNIFFTAGSDFHGANKVQGIGEISPQPLSNDEQAFFEKQITNTISVFKKHCII